MADPFTDVSVSGYNSNPPADDGTEVAANRVLWATIKTKLTDPIKTAIESLVTNTGVAFDKVSGGYRTTAISYQVVSGDHGKLIRASASGITITTPSGASVGAPFFFSVLNNSSGDITLDGSGSETIDGNASVTIPKNRGLVLFTDGTNWFSQGINWHTESRPIQYSTPRGRLTLTSGAPVLGSDVTGATTVYYTPYQGNSIMLPDSSGDWAMTEFSEVSQALSDNTKSPAAALADNLYDLFGWLDSATFRVTRGPAWSSSSSRGAGAGTTELVMLDGVLVNANAISNGPGAQRGVYLGTIATNGSNQLNMMFAPNAAAGGSANRLDVWNMFNRVVVASVARDSTDNWTYTTATLRSANGSDSNRVTMVIGLNEDAVSAVYSALASNTNAARNLRVGIGKDSTSAIATGSLPGFAVTAASQTVPLMAQFQGLPGLGRRFFQALEYSEALNTTTWYGDNGEPTITQTGLIVQARM